MSSKQRRTLAEIKTVSHEVIDIEKRFAKAKRDATENNNRRIYIIYSRSCCPVRR